MLFSSYTFIFVFLPIVWLGFHFIKRIDFSFKFFNFQLDNFDFAKLFLIIASLYFYAYFKLEYLGILLGSIVVNYFIARQILKSKNVGKLVNISESNISFASNGGGGAIA